MEAPYQLEFTENIYYSIGNNPSIKEIIESLQGWEAIIKQSKGVLAELTGSDILEMEVRVQKLEVGSLTEKLLIKLGFGTEENFDKFLEGAHKKFIGEGKMRSALVWTVIAGIFATGMYQAAKNMAPNSTSHFEANNNTIINIGAGETNISPERIQSLIDSTLVDKKVIAKSAVKVLAPARNDDNATLQVGSDNTSITIPSDLIKRTPTEVVFEPDIYTREHYDVDLEIRALDLDNPSKGWAAVIPGLVDRRVKLVLAPGIKPDDLSHKFAYRADVTITYKLTSTKGNAYKPTEIFLSKLITE
ncbi:hypothetical protein FHU10_0602 [Serratia fonticola]|uniref:Uncharacterized protein n=1 Tax=Serratia fonticola TaxID=47917 RepID=A0A542D6C7_SERFO|nr:hypothetical protein [Serratia fonticola]TQI79324.1 hypothetical protein FHU09_1847 [Serratia fonticola]TQI98651.1 hypothetical protein FHU11_4201 [Serratia fonticola]TVZ68178.1 hypothetical protein FHU10_0602 [Serratia fonticola]